MQDAIESIVAEYSGRYLPESLARAAIVEVGRRTYLRGFVAANDGNISVRIAENLILATPTGRSKGFIREDELVKMTLSGEKLEGPLAPSSEVRMHLRIYEARPDVMAVDHAHPPICTGFAVAGIPLDKCVLAEVVMTLGAIPLAEFAVPSTQELADAVADRIRDCDAVLLANHGAVTVGPDVFAAHYSMERIEHLANISLVARLLGGEKRQELRRRRLPAGPVLMLRVWPRIRRLRNGRLASRRVIASPPRPPMFRIDLLPRLCKL